MPKPKSDLFHHKIRSLLERSFQHGIKSVQPHNVLRNNIKRNGDRITIQEKSFHVSSAYIVGFGKAVGGMVTPLLDVLQGAQQNCIKKGILSVPVGFKKSMTTKNWYVAPKCPNIDIFEGAENNLPDDSALKTANEIVKLAKKLTEEDTLFVLISGGGSALLPMPIPGLSLTEKAYITMQLSKSGATIQEINAVRRSLSAVKGGKLACSTNARIICLIISDVIGDSLQVIASGPTCGNTDPPQHSMNILKKYDVQIDLSIPWPESISPSVANFAHVHNFIIANNRTAVEAVKEYITEHLDIPSIPIILTSEIQGEAFHVGGLLGSLGFNMLQHLESGNNLASVTHDCREIGIANKKIEEMLATLENTPSKCKSVCLIFGGETTVVVRGKGIGGRNQELILSGSLKFQELSKAKQPVGNIVLLSGGTDGIDGPTDAAGAVTYYTKALKSSARLQTSEAASQSLDPSEFLKNNNSYEYFRQLSSGSYHLKTGHTGTNVMDLIILFVSIDDSESGE